MILIKLESALKLATCDLVFGNIEREIDCCSKNKLLSC